MKLETIAMLCGLILGSGLGFICGHYVGTFGDGDLGQHCKPDGTCNGSLVCKETAFNGWTGSWVYYCQLPPTGAKP